jgi:hypothetical protein
VVLAAKIGVPAMPSRPVVVLILLFWLAVLGVVVYREVVPHFFNDEPPAPEFVAADELSQATVSWSIYRGPADADEKIGKMTSRIEYVGDDDSFRFVNTYHKLKLALLAFEVTVTSATTVLRVDRDGRLKGQTLRGNAEMDTGRLGGGLKLAATAEASGVVRGGFLEGSATLTAPDLLGQPSVGTFTPVAVPDGQVINPLMPVDRLRGVVPGRRWKVRQVDPLREALGELLVKGLQEELARRGGGKKAPTAVTIPPPPELLAEVLRDPVTLDRPGGPVGCWVIEYRCEKPPIEARTYVRRDDGRVLRQEATASGERLRFERDE